MAVAIIEIPGLPTGLTLTLDLFPRGSDTAAASWLSLTERTNTKTLYRTTTSAGLDGWHAAVVKSGGSAIASFWIDMDDTATVHYATDTSPEAIDAVGALAGSGARTVTITVDDGTDPLQGAKVRLTKGAESYLVSTDADGLAEFLLDDGTWTVTITLALYTFTSTTLVVDGNETVTQSLGLGPQALEKTVEAPLVLSPASLRMLAGQSKKAQVSVQIKPL